jgi:hypothetical protein
MLPNDKTNQGARPAVSTLRTHPIDSDLIITGERQKPRFKKKERQQPLFLMMFLLSCVIFQIDGPCRKKRVRILHCRAEPGRAAPLVLLSMYAAATGVLLHIEIVLRQIQVKGHNPGFLILYRDFIWANTCQICELDGLC